MVRELVCHRHIYLPRLRRKEIIVPWRRLTWDGRGVLGWGKDGEFPRQVMNYPPWE